jgi:hypothetical protein
LRTDETSPGSRLTIGAVALSVVLALWGGDVARWLSAALLLWVGPSLIRPLGSHPLVARVRPHLPLLLLGLLSLALLGDLLLGRPPATRDHGVHYFQTHVLVDHLLPSRQLTGWSSSLNNGYPFGDSYPVLGYLWVGAFHVLSFGLIPLRMSYAWGLLAVWLVSMWGIWQLTALVVREIQARAQPSDDAEPTAYQHWLSRLSPAWAGCIAAGLWLIDPGSSRRGGWDYAMFHGVWPQLLSSGLWIAAISLTWRAFNKPSPRMIAVAALFLAGSVLAHPFGMLTAAGSALTWLVVLRATRVDRELPPGVYRTWTAIHLAAALVAAGWVISFLASAQFMGRTPVPGLNLPRLAIELLTGELFEAQRHVVGPLALIGLLVTARSGRAVAWLCLACFVGMLVVSSEAALTVLRLDLVISSFKNVQFPRFALALKPIWYGLGGIGAALLLGALVRSRAGAPASPGLKRLLACVLFAPIAVSVLDDTSRITARPVGALLTLEGTRYQTEERALAQALESEARALGELPLRVAFFRKKMSSGTYPMFTIADANAGVVLDGHVPSVNFLYRITRRNPGILRTLGVTHVLHDRPFPDREQAIAKATETVGTYGVYTLDRLLPDEGGTLDAGTLVLDPGGVQVEKWTDREIVLDVPEGTGTKPVELTIAPYRKWVARDASGASLKLSVHKRSRGLSGLAVLTSQPGKVTLRYEATQRERIAAWVSLIALFSCLGALAFPRPLAMAERLHSPAAQRLSAILAGLTLLIALAIAARKADRQLVETWKPVIEYHVETRKLSEGTERTFSRDIIDDRDYRIVIDPGDACDALFSKSPLPGCSEASARPRVSTAYRSPFLYRCLRVDIPPRGTVEIIVDDVPPTEAVLGFLKRRSDGRGGDELYFTVTGAEGPRVAHSERRHFHVRPDQHQGTVSIELHNENLHVEAACVSLAAAE